MKMHFYKYQGTGNDFVIVDNLNGDYSNLSKKQIAYICDRRFGVGADGLILLEKDDNHAFYMRYYNSDGREASMCGNGGRCIVAFAYHMGIISKKTEFLAFDGLHEAIVKTENYVQLKMSPVSDVKKMDDGLFLDTGSPHFVKFTEEVKNIDVKKEGRIIRNNNDFSPDGTNVNFVELTEKDTITVRTYERGVENETLSCGTGVVASSLCTYFSQGFQHEIKINALGGQLKVKYEVTSDIDGSFKFDNIWLSGEASLVFKGSIEID